MAILPILKYPDPILKQPAVPVVEFDQNLKSLADNMIETMHDAPGVGLAAPQVGHSIRLVVIDDSPEEAQLPGSSILVLVNPKIINREGSLIFEEGCLSVVDYSAEVTRSAQVMVEAQDLEGRRRVYSPEGRLAVVFQHELDHLDGILFLDRIGQVKRDLYKRRLRKLARQAQQN